MEKKTQIMVGSGVVLVTSLIGAYFVWSKYSNKPLKSEETEDKPENIEMEVVEKE